MFGYIDTTGLPSKFTTGWMQPIENYEDDTKNSQWLFVTNNLFFSIAVKPGSYQVTSLREGNNVYFLGKKGGNETSAHVKKPGVYFMGSYKYIPHKKGMFEDDEFEMKRIKLPSEKSVLKMLLKEMDAPSWLHEYTHQLGMMKKRIAELP